MRVLSFLMVLTVAALASSQAVAPDSTTKIQWLWDGFNMKKHKKNAPVDIREFGLDPIIEACFGSKFTSPSGRKTRLKWYECTPDKPNNNFIGPDGTMRTWYKQWHWGSRGGAQWYRNFTNFELGESAILEYHFRFSPRFFPNKGGKLPGLYGGHRACSGGNQAESQDCFSMRLMWRRQFGASTYMYIPISLQTDEFCKHCYVPDIPNPTCADVQAASDEGALDLAVQAAAGVPTARMMAEPERAYCDFGRQYKLGSYPHNESYYTFFPNSKHGAMDFVKITQYVRLNDIAWDTNLPVPNGVYALYINDQLVHHTPYIVYRANRNLDISGLFFSTFMGGQDPSWGPKRTQYTEWKHFQVTSAYHNVTAGIAVPGGAQAYQNTPLTLAVWPPLPRGITEAALSTERTCMNSTGHVAATIGPARDSLTVTFPYPGLFVLCLRGWASHTTLFLSQDAATINVF